MVNKMILLKTFRLKIHISNWLEILLIAITACAPGQTTPPNPTAIPQPSVTATIQCEQELVLPQIMEIRPAQVTPGSEITVIGSGGYIQDSCGGYIEGSRIFKMYLDNEPIGDLSCYVNRCEGKITLPRTLSTGVHCLSVEVGNCQFEFQTI
jgi:hypothetical protein